MTSMPARQIELFEEMSALSTRMVEAARTADWERLDGLEASVAALRQRLMEAGDDNDALSPDDIETKRTLIQRILEDDAEIRRHTEPWMDHLRGLLGDNARKRRIEQTYGAGF